MIKVKKTVCFSFLLIFILLILSAANYTTNKPSDEELKLSNQISLLQNQLREKTNTIKMLRKENQDFKRQIAGVPRQIEIAKAKLEALYNTRTLPLPLNVSSLLIKSIYVDENDYTSSIDLEKIVQVTRYQGITRLNPPPNDIYLPLDVISILFNKSIKWDDKNKILYFY